MMNLSLMACNTETSEQIMQEEETQQTADDLGEVEKKEETAQDKTEEETESEEAESTKQEQEEAVLLGRYATQLKETDLNGICFDYQEYTDGDVAYYRTNGISGLDYVQDGCLYKELMDLDGDGRSELLTINLERSAQGCEFNTAIYEAENGKVVQSAQKTFLAGALGDQVDGGTIRFLLQDDKYICMDSRQNTFVSADGMLVDLMAFYYDGSNLIQTADFHFLGSDMYELGKESTELMDQLYTMKLDKTASAVYDRDVFHFCAADEGVEALLKIHIRNSMEVDEASSEEKPYADVIQCKKTDMGQGYLLKDSNTRILSMEEIRYMSKENLRIARNEIYARYGWRFEDRQLQDYFNRQSWYAPGENVDDSILSDIELANKNLIVEAENNAKDEPIPLIDYFNAVEGAEPLDAKELGYIAGFLSGMDAYGFTMSFYDDIRDVNLNEVFYSCAGLETGEVSNASVEEYMRIENEKELYTDFSAIKESDIDALLKEKTGYGLSDMHFPLGWTYIPGQQAYGRQAGDTNYMQPQVVDGIKTPDGTYYIEYENQMYRYLDETSNCILVLKKTEDGYQFVANRIMR